MRRHVINSLVFQIVESLFQSLADCMWNSPPEHAQIEAEDKEQKILEEIESLKTPVAGGNILESKSAVMKGSNSAGIVVEGNSLGKLNHCLNGKSYTTYDRTTGTFIKWRGL